MALTSCALTEWRAKVCSPEEWYARSIVLHSHLEMNFNDNSEIPLFKGRNSLELELDLLCLVLSKYIFNIIPPEWGLYCNHLVCPSVRPFVRPFAHFRNRYLSFYWKKWFYIWYMALAWWLVPCLPFPGLPHIYFLFTVRHTNERVGVFLARCGVQHLVLIGHSRSEERAGMKIGSEPLLGIWFLSRKEGSVKRVTADWSRLNQRQESET